MPHTASAASNESEIVYIDTEVEDIAFTQHPTCVFFGFKLTVSDYDDFGSWQGDYAHTDTYNKYEQYITSQLTYWKNFSQLNSEGARFDQLYAYWSAGWDTTAQAYPLPPTQFANSVAHRSTLARLEFGFTFYIPAGTTFPSATYVKNGCQGAPIMYRTVEDKAFYYDGSKFQTFSYAVAQTRQVAIEEVNAIDYSVYQELERAEVRALVKKVSEQLNVSFTKFAIQDTLSAFYAELDEIMTIADYQALAEKKTTAKSELLAFFNGLERDLYETADWDKILSMQSEYSALIDALGSVEEVDAAVAGVKFTVGNVLTKVERADFAAYQEAAMQRLEASFVETLYREQERIQGAAWLQEAKTIIEQATTKNEVDSAELTYTARIRELKTQAQWEKEEEQKQQYKPIDSTVKEETSVDETPPQERGCGSSLNQMGITLGIAIAALMIINKKKDGQRDEK
ncbi:MAG: hypothetical protein IJ393_01560 [Clostridia bacterium]|nr:hypothetical protein [Clostridia bacterium]